MLPRKIQELRADARVELRGGLEGDVLEQRAIRIAVEREERAIGAAVRAPRPPPAAHDGPADVEADVVELLHAVALAGRTRKVEQFVGQVVALQVLSRADVVRCPGRAVGSAS